MQRIQSITLRNFKFFYGTETEQAQNKLLLNQNNLLLYGENGSGKSSIYWALYTHLQSCIKEDGQITKYFDPADNENERPIILKETRVNADDWEYKFFLKEDLRVIKELNGNFIFSNPNCLLDMKRNNTQDVNTPGLNANAKLFSIYGSVRYQLGIKTKETDTIKKYEDVLFMNGENIIK